MKLLHLSDLHIGRELFGYSLRQDQEHILAQITDIAKKHRPDAVIIAGDVYDRAVPAGEAYTVFDRFLCSLTQAVPKAAIIIIAGNHDSPQRLAYAAEFLKNYRIYISTLPPQHAGERLKKVVLTDRWGSVSIYLCPFIKPSLIQGLMNEEHPGEELQSLSYEQAFRAVLEREDIDTTQRNVIAAHQLFIHNSTLPIKSDSEQVSVQIGGLDQIETDTMADFDYAALGHIHRPQSAGEERFYYCGTPLSYSVSEAGQQKGAVLVTLEQKGTPPVIETIPFTPLHRVVKLEDTFEKLLNDPQYEQYYNDYVSITLTDNKELYMPKQQLEKLYSRILDIRLKEALLPGEETDCSQEKLAMPPQELFEEFYREVWKTEMSPEEKEYLKGVLDNETDNA